ncbi:helix-turn-helix transcriptional regulator [Streptomyces salinarius]|uniref:helix-turn-helix domain-containing protein n=1 Tax=Streptomyces TaxID=1883 RepID=UPI001BF0C710|nr:MULTISPECIES: helix-turn-helix transcriptional regulator [unclassified Streptomyces]QUW96034.1 HTH-type transcriptional activator RhaR [Streptomyces sp. V17-9]WKX23228.1 helix-turn-helix transcriptional regulator [Streptomyces sp. HUAS CX7]
MVKTGHVSVIRQMTYQPAGRPATSVETMTFGRLRELNDGGTQRADFHVLAVVDAGPGSVTVDFRQHPLQDQSAVWIPPGAVHRWDDIADVAGHLVLFVPTAPVTHATRELAASPELAAHWSIPDADWPFVDTARNHLLLEASALPSESRTELPEILLSALITRLHPPHAEARLTPQVFRLFRSNVEAHFRRHRDADYYARALGYAPRTLSRAVQQATGRTAKAYIVERIVLEAKRLLAHDRLTAARCADVLGFPDASNFSAFFRRATGMRPGAWQAMMAAE